MTTTPPGADLPTTGQREPWSANTASGVQPVALDGHVLNVPERHRHVTQQPRDLLGSGEADRQDVGAKINRRHALHCYQY